MSILVLSFGCHSQSSIWKDASTNGACKGSSQGAANTHSVVHMLTWLVTCELISYYEVAQTNTTFPPVMGNIGRIVKGDCLNPHMNPSTSISMCHIYHQCSMDKNASSDDKRGIKILMPNTKLARISLEWTCNNDIIHIKISAKIILIFCYLCTWYETISLISLILNSLHSFWYGINSLTTQFSMFRIYCNVIFFVE